jgi:hypothetical protein
MRPVRIITAVAFAAAVAVTGCTAHSTTADPSTMPAAPVAAASASPAPALATPAPKQPTAVAQQPTPVPKPPGLADGRYDAYIWQVSSRSDFLVVDLVQVFHDQAARDAAIADGMAPDKAKYLGVYVRNQNPRLRTLQLAGDLRLDLRGGDCEAPRNHQLTKLAADARSMSGSVHTYYFTLTVRGGAVHQVQEFLAINAC